MCTRSAYGGEKAHRHDAGDAFRSGRRQPVCGGRSPSAGGEGQTHNIIPPATSWEGCWGRLKPPLHPPYHHAPRGRVQRRRAKKKEKRALIEDGRKRDTFSRVGMKNDNLALWQGQLANELTLKCCGYVLTIEPPLFALQRGSWGLVFA